MSVLDTIPEEDLVWDYYYRLYYDDDDDFQNTIYTTTKMEDGDRTTENENPALDIALDDDDDDDDTTPPPGTPGATSTPYPPGATSTPYHQGESIEMSDMSQEQSGMVHDPGDSAWKALTFIFPDAKATEVETYIEPKSQRLVVKKAGAGQTPYYLFTKERATG